MGHGWISRLLDWPLANLRRRKCISTQLAYLGFLKNVLYCCVCSLGRVVAFGIAFLISGYIQALCVNVMMLHWKYIALPSDINSLNTATCK